MLLLLFAYFGLVIGSWSWLSVEFDPKFPTELRIEFRELWEYVDAAAFWNSWGKNVNFNEWLELFWMFVKVSVHVKF